MAQDILFTLIILGLLTNGPCIRFFTDYAYRQDNLGTISQTIQLKKEASDINKKKKKIQSVLQHRSWHFTQQSNADYFLGTNSFLVVVLAGLIRL